MINYNEKLKQLKFIYSGAIPNQNLKVIEDRINYPDCGPNKLILEVSVTEALARTILTKLFIAQGSKPKNAFRKTKDLKVKEVVQKIYELKQMKMKLPSLFKSDSWKTFIWAIKFRNFLVHNAAFVGSQTSAPLIRDTKAVREVIMKEWF